MMKKMITLLAVAGLVLALAPAAQASIILIDNSTNNGSFEGTISDGAVTGWTRTDVTGSFCSIYSFGDDTGKTGHNVMVANTPSSATFTSGAIAQTIGAGDSFSFDFWTSGGSVKIGTVDVDVYLIFDGGVPQFWQTAQYISGPTPSWDKQVSASPFTTGPAATDVAFQLVFTGGDNQPLLDDVTFTLTEAPVPEPEPASTNHGDSP
jgi:hypothetical protein